MLPGDEPPVPFPPKPAAATRGQLPPNPLDYRPVLRALYVAMDQWVRTGTAPPPSRYPRLSDRTLVTREQLNVHGYAKINIPATPIVPVRTTLASGLPLAPQGSARDMERGNSKHGPRLDDEMSREVSGTVQGTAGSRCRQRSPAVAGREPLQYAAARL